MSKNNDTEILEQARLLGMSGEREAKHLARIEHLERELAFVTVLSDRPTKRQPALEVEHVVRS